jgi:tRNA A37 methylthiotransferase MiaB
MINIKIQDGCSQNCSYCIVKTIRGKSESVSFDDIVKDIMFFIEKTGDKDICICGINTLEYNHPSIGNFCDLIKELLKRFPTIKFYIDNINPFNKKILFELMDIIAKNRNKIDDTFGISIQSASDNILKQMHRPYTRKDLEEIFIYAKELGLNVTTEIICGFPGETEEEFLETYNLLKDFHLDFIVHAFSIRPGTEASDLPNKIPEKELAKRMERYRELKSINEENHL